MYLNKPKVLVFIVILIISFVSCRSDDSTSSKAHKTREKMISTAKPIKEKKQFYDFTKPSKTLVLDYELVEISGLAYDYHNDQLLAQNDEKGYVYELEKNTGKIKNKHKFGSKGDYEGITFRKGEYIVAKSNGDLYFFNPKTQITERIKTSLSSKNDVEGLFYNKKNDLLLLACKGQSLSENNSKKEKSIYRFDFDKKDINTKPFATILDTELSEYTEQRNSKIPHSKMKNLLNRVKDFSPSGIAMHPTSGEVYLLSARGSTLIILDETKKLSRVVYLNKNTISQPEGICFDQYENLYISSEGKGLNGKIFVFNPSYF